MKERKMKRYIQIKDEKHEMLTDIPKKLFKAAPTGVVKINLRGDLNPRVCNGADFLFEFVIPKIRKAFDQATGLKNGIIYGTEEIVQHYASVYKVVEESGEMEPGHNCVIVDFSNSKTEISAVEYCGD